MRILVLSIILCFLPACVSNPNYSGVRIKFGLSGIIGDVLGLGLEFELKQERKFIVDRWEEPFKEEELE